MALLASGEDREMILMRSSNQWWIATPPCHCRMISTSMFTALFALSLVLEVLKTKAPAILVGRGSAEQTQFIDAINAATSSSEM